MTIESKTINQLQESLLPAPTDWVLVADESGVARKARVGNAGFEGPQGPQGLQGDTGPAGPTGPQGPQGPAGADGFVGADGTSGVVIQAEPPVDTDVLWIDSDDAVTPYLAELTGATFTGQVKGITPVAAEDLTRKDYVDGKAPQVWYTSNTTAQAWSGTMDVVSWSPNLAAGTYIVTAGLDAGTTVDTPNSELYLTLIFNAALVRQTRFFQTTQNLKAMPSLFLQHRLVHPGGALNFTLRLSGTGGGFLVANATSPNWIQAMKVVDGA